jgi:short-subunit dehydrogenase
LATQPPPRPHINLDRTALITGASSGIGEAFARVFAAHGWHLVITARRQDRLHTLQHELEAHYRVQVRSITADLADPASPTRLADELAGAGVHVDALVNNAGYGIAGNLLASPWPTHAAFLRVMVTSVVELSYRFLPPMIDQGYGRIINIASVAGIVPPVGGHTLYAASKSFVIKFSQSLSAEVRGQGVHVTALCPGFTLSEFHDVTGTRQMVRQLPAWMWMDAYTVAKRGYDAVMAGDVVRIPGVVNRTMAALSKLLPEPLVLAAVRRNASKFRKT